MAHLSQAAKYVFRRNPDLPAFVVISSQFIFDRFFAHRPKTKTAAPWRQLELPLKSLVLTTPVSTVSHRKQVLKTSFYETKYKDGTIAKVVKGLVWRFPRSVGSVGSTQKSGFLKLQNPFDCRVMIIFPVPNYETVQAVFFILSKLYNRNYGTVIHIRRNCRNYGRNPLRPVVISRQV